MRIRALFVVIFAIIFSHNSNAQESFIKKNKQWVTPIILSGLGLALYNQPSKNLQLEFRDEYLPNFQTKMDDFLQFSPTLLLIGANVAQRISNNPHRPLKDKLSVFVIGTGTYVIISQVLKRGINDIRPDGGDFSFPSGHTTTAFFGARILDKEFRKTQPWLVVGGYTLASATGVLRIANNRHWVSDVFVGAGLGIASAEFAYWLYPKLKSKTDKKQAFHFEPMIAPDFYMAKASYSF